MHQSTQSPEAAGAASRSKKFVLMAKVGAIMLIVLFQICTISV